MGCRLDNTIPARRYAVTTNVIAFVTSNNSATITAVRLMQPSRALASSVIFDLEFLHLGQAVVQLNGSNVVESRRRHPKDLAIK